MGEAEAEVCFFVWVVWILECACMVWMGVFGSGCGENYMCMMDVMCGAKACHVYMCRMDVMCGAKHAMCTCVGCDVWSESMPCGNGVCVCDVFFFLRVYACLSISCGKIRARKDHMHVCMWDVQMCCVCVCMCVCVYV